MFPSSDNPIPCEHRGRGVVVVRIGDDTPGERVRLRFSRRGKGVLHRDLARKKGGFYMELIRQGFLKTGAITLDGCLEMPPPDNDRYQPLFKTVLQTDGDVICTIDRRLLGRNDAATLLQSYTRIREAFLKDLQTSLEISRRRLLALIGSAMSVGGAGWYLWRLCGG